MVPFLWRHVGDNCYAGQAGPVQATCQPPHGLQLITERLIIPAVLGVEIVSAVGLDAQQLVTAENDPEVVIKQDILLAKYAPSNKRNIECDIRWRISPHGSIDLEVSALTPGKWENLGVQTCSQLPPGELVLLDEVVPPIVVYRSEGHEISYVEFCHPQDGLCLDRETLAEGNIKTRFKLFGHDLEKGVILRGRLRGQVVPRATDVSAAKASYQRFLGMPPNLSL